MSALKGFDRIALVLAIIAIVPGAYIGYLWDQNFRKIVVPEVSEFEQKVRDGPWEPLPSERWNYPSAWVSAMVGLLIFGTVSFIIVLSSILVTIRLAVFSIRGSRFNDKIASALSIIAIMPAFYVGYSLHHKTGRFARWPWSYDNWISVIWGYLFALIFFPVLIYGIRGASRLILWIAEGFKGDGSKGR